MRDAAAREIAHVGLYACRRQQQVRLERLAVIQMHHDACGGWREPDDATSGENARAALGKRAFDEAGRHAIEIGAENLRLHFDDGDVGAAFDEIFGRVHADQPAAQHDGPTRGGNRRLQLQRIVERTQHMIGNLLDAGDRRNRRRCPRRQQELVVGDLGPVRQRRGIALRMKPRQRAIGHVGDVLPGKIIRRAQKHIVRRRTPGNDIGQHGGRIGKPAVARHQRETSLGVVHADGADGFERRMTAADDEILGVHHGVLNRFR